MYKEIGALLDNTVFQARVDKDEKVVSYLISPVEGYKLHEITLDEIVIDKATGIETGEVIKGYTKAYVTAGSNYNFEVNNREIYAVKE